MCRTYCLLLGIVWIATRSFAAGVTIVNAAGNVEVLVGSATRLTVSGSTPQGPARPADFRILQNGEDFQVEVLPRESALNVKVQMPLGYGLEVTTTDGDISVEGMVHSARLDTKTGGLHLIAPLEGIRVTLDAATQPAEFVDPDPDLFRTFGTPTDDGPAWRLRDRLADDAISYGDYRITAEAPRRVELTEFSPPSDWPLRFPWDAKSELANTLAPPDSASVSPSDVAATNAAASGEVVFSSHVRMVNLTVSVTDSKGRPAPGLTADDFHIVEDGRAQQIGPIQAGDAAFNLAILLDMSGSAERLREPMQVAARRLVEMARPGDRVAIYALTYGMFQVVSPLSTDREALLSAVDNLPAVAGASPLYDIITLAYAQELRQRPGDRNALIVLSDGLDNRLTGGSGPSTVRFADLRRVAEEMDAILYPIFLLSRDPPPPRYTREVAELKRDRQTASRRMQALAAATGGTVFPAKSINDLDPVFPLIEAELRSVYAVGYYPGNQDADGSWRTVEVSVENPKLEVRTRPGYYAK